MRAGHCRGIEKVFGAVRVSEADRRIDLSAAHRLALRLGLSDGLANHFSVRLEGDSNHFLVTPYGVHWSEVSASCFPVVNCSGQVVEGEGEVDPAAIFIHSSIFKRRADISCVLHTHQLYSTAITLLKKGRLLPVSQTALRFHARIAYHDVYEGAVDSAEGGDRLVRALGDRYVLLHAHHGVVVAGVSVARAFDDLYFLERASRLQILAQATGEKLCFIPDEVAAGYVSDERPNNLKKQALSHFATLKRILDREEPDYRE